MPVTLTAPVDMVVTGGLVDVEVLDDEAEVFVETAVVDTVVEILVFTVALVVVFGFVLTVVFAVVFKDVVFEENMAVLSLIHSAVGVVV